MTLTNKFTHKGFSTNTPELTESEKRELEKWRGVNKEVFNLIIDNNTHYRRFTGLCTDLALNAVRGVFPECTKVIREIDIYPDFKDVNIMDIPKLILNEKPEGMDEILSVSMEEATDYHTWTAITVKGLMISTEYEEYLDSKELLEEFLVCYNTELEKWEHNKKLEQKIESLKAQLK